MIINNCFKNRNFILTAVFITSLGLDINASAQEHSFLVDLNSRTVTSLGTLGGNFSQAYGINKAGQVVGASDTIERDPFYRDSGYPHAFITGPNGMGMRDLGTLDEVWNLSTAEDINNAGQVVGWIPSIFDSPAAFITGSNGMSMRALGTLGGSSRANGINNAGQTVGWFEAPGEFGLKHAFVTGPNGIGMRDLGVLEGGNYSEAFGINDAGQVVGFSQTGQLHHAFITGPDGTGMRDIGTLGGDYSIAEAINGAGQVVGYSTPHPIEPSSFFFHAFITGPDGMGMRDLGTLGGGASFASDINDAGQVVGKSYTAESFELEDYHAFITGPDGEGMMDLNSLVDLPQGVILTNATGINNNGQVIAIGTIIPEPETYALMLTGLGLIGFMARRKKAESLIKRC